MKSFFKSYAFIALPILVAFLPVALYNYLHTDDYFWSNWGGFSCASVISFLSIVGRPITGLIYCTGSLVNKIDYFNFLRILSILNITVLAYLTFRWMIIFGVTREISALIAISIYTLPPFQVYSAYLSTSPFGLSASIAAMAGIIIYSKILCNSGLLNKVKYSLISIIVIIISLSIYQPNSLIIISFLIIPVTIYSIQFKLSNWHKIVIFYFLIIGISCGLYYLLWRSGLNYHEIPLGGKYDARVTVGNIYDRLRWFLLFPLNEALNLWNIFPNYFFSLFIALISILLFFLNIYKTGKDCNKNIFYIIIYFLFNLSFIIFLIFSSFGISLLSASPSPEYRTYGALSVGIFSFLSINISKYLNRFKSSLLLNRCLFIIVALVGVFSANSAVREYFAYPDSRELSFIKNSINSYILHNSEDFNWVHIITPNEAIARSKQRNEIGEPTSLHGPNIRPLVLVALDDLSLNKSVRVTHSDSINSVKWNEWDNELRGLNLGNKSIDPSYSNTIIIDMSIMYISRPKE